MMKWSVSTICALTKGQLLQGDSELSIAHIELDSRKALHAEHCLFIALKGVRHDSHRLLPELYSKGLRCFLIEQEIDPSPMPEATFVLVQDSVLALQALAAHRRAQFTCPVIGITGSNGKTTVKEWLNLLLSDDLHIVRSPKSYNSQVGVPLSIWNMEPHHQLGIFEAGISEPNEMERLARVIQPTIGILTTVGTAHMENFLSRRQLIGEKLHLLAQAPVVLVPDDADVLQLIAPWIDVKTVCIVPKCHWVNRPTNQGENVFRLGKEEQTFSVAFDDLASIENVATCIVCMRHLGYSDQVINDRLKRLSALEMRLQLIEGENGSLIVNDAYSNDLNSLEIALDFLARNARGKEKAVVLSDFLQSGWLADELHAKVSEMLNRHGVTRWYNIGPNSPATSRIFQHHYRWFPSTEVFLAEHVSKEFEHVAVLIKGARAFAFERIVAAFQFQSHDSVLHIDLNALVHNLNYFKSKLHPNTKLMVMVKAFGYGIGAPQVASMLMFNKVDYLAVAYTDEGVALRKAGISLPIMVMNPEKGSLNALIKFNLEPEIYSVRTLKAFVQALQVQNFSGEYAIHIKLDTGMRRLGFEESQIEQLVALLSDNTQLKVASIFTHLAATDNPLLDDFTNLQLQSFERMVAQFTGHLSYRPLLHALNTGGIQRFNAAQYDMVRLGVGLYGVSASAEEQGALLPVNALRTVISQIKWVKKGESIGYNRAYIAPREMRSATIPLGYADGLRRQLSNGVGHVHINGQKAPIVGNVCMDMCMIDVTDIACEEGDLVEVFGQHQSVAAFAKACGTIAYEVLTSISQRVKRIYSQD